MMLSLILCVGQVSTIGINHSKYSYGLQSQSVQIKNIKQIHDNVKLGNSSFNFMNKDKFAKIKITFIEKGDELELLKMGLNHSLPEGMNLPSWEPGLIRSYKNWGKYVWEIKPTKKINTDSGLSIIKLNKSVMVIFIEYSNWNDDYRNKFYKEMIYQFDNYDKSNIDIIKKTTLDLELSTLSDGVSLIEKMLTENQKNDLKIDPISSFLKNYPLIFSTLENEGGLYYPNSKLGLFMNNCLGLYESSDRVSFLLFLEKNKLNNNNRSINKFLSEFKKQCDERIEWPGRFGPYLGD